MRNPIVWYLFATLLLFPACAHKAPKQEQGVQQAANPYSTFSEAVSAIGQGDVNQILALRNEPSNTQMAEFLRTLYARYGNVQQIHAVAFERENQVARGIFLAEHKSGPFLWDMIVDGDTYTMLRGTNDFSTYLQPVPPVQAALSLAERSMQHLNRGESAEVFSNLICNCISADAFERQVRDLAERAGPETAREFIRAETIPGLKDQLQVLHFLSKRQGIHLGYHFTMWKVDNQWRINSVNWTQEELLPQPLKHVTQR